MTPDQFGIVSVKPPLAPSVSPGPNGIISVLTVPIKSTSNSSIQSYETRSDGIVQRGDIVNGN